MTILANLPQVSSRNIAVHVRLAAERALHNKHPWVFENSIRKQSKDGQAGDIAIIFDKKDKFLAVGLYDPTSPIRIKVLQHHTASKINDSFFHDKLQEASRHREALLNTDTNGYRLIYGEGDGLPALIIDRYDNVLVIKLYSSAWFPHLPAILNSLNKLLPNKIIVLRLSRLVSEGETFGLYDGMVLQGDLISNEVIFRENGLLFAADVVDGHKTGFFFDQRDNRLRVRELVVDKTVLDVFSYNGGFSVNAAAGGAKSVLSLDISEPALNSAMRNMHLNTDKQNIANCEHEILVTDAFEGLAQLAQRKKIFDMVIVDPPTFASSQAQVEGALQAYRKLVELALKLINTNGILVMASCSSRVTAVQFFALVHNTAIRVGRPLEEIERTQHALDHPIRFAEGAYLKCLFAKALY